MPSDRKFHRRTITVTVLSEEPYEVEDLGQIVRDIIEGDQSGAWEIGQDEVLSGPEMAKALIAQGSDPEFFQLTEEGEDTSDCDHCCEQGDDD